VVGLYDNFMQWGSPRILLFLFSTWNGAFLWSPILLLGLVGLFFFEDRGLRWALIAAFLLEVYACAAAQDWWGSAGFGARRLTSVAPLAGFGVAVLLARARAAMSRSRLRTIVCTGAIILCTAWNLRLAQQTLSGRIPFNPANRYEYIRRDANGQVRVYGFWEYGRLFRDWFANERQ
jgi:hypothetical protein